jgi:Flp pilus assembly pilin Flp
VLYRGLRGYDMTTIYSLISKSTRGQSTTEYVLVAALIAVVLYSVYVTLTGAVS